MSLAPIALFIYNRPWHTKKTLDALAANAEAKESILYIYCDGPKENASEKELQEIAAARVLTKNEIRFKEVIIKEQPKNKGLANSIIAGVTEVVNRHNNIIVIEDDIVSSKYFLQYMNKALSLYEANNDIISISAYIFPIKELPETFFVKGADCWGWATWKRGWDLFEPDGSKLLAELEEKQLTDLFDLNNSYPYTQMLKDQIAKKNSSWAIRWYASAFLKNKFTLYPGKTLVKNIGFDGSGEHKTDTDRFEDTLEEIPRNPECSGIFENKIAREKMSLYLKQLRSQSNITVSNKLKIQKTVADVLPKGAKKIFRKIFPK